MKPLSEVASCFGHSDPDSSSVSIASNKAELLQINRTQFPSLGIFVRKKVGNQKN